MVTSPVEIRLPAWVAGLAVPSAPAGDGALMRLALQAAAENVAHGTGGPFGACIRNDVTGEIIGIGVNLVPATGNPVLHAETVALTMAAARLAEPGSYTLFTSCEPCIMCLGAAHWARVARVVSSASKSDAEAVGFSEGAGTRELRTEMAARGVVFQDGYLHAEGAAVLRRYAETGGAIYGPAA